MSGPKIPREVLVNQARAADPAATAWVAANAGSGKTHVLVNRVIRLLLEGAPPANILCLTYTKAAAAEMITRLARELGRWVIINDAELIEIIEDLTGSAADKPCLEQARKLFARALETPGGLKIQTIHAFCERLLKRFPLEAEIPPHFEVMDEITTQTILTRARDHVLMKAAENPDTELGRALGRLAAFSDETGFDKDVREIIGKRSQLYRFIIQTGDMDRAIAHIRQALQAPPDLDEAAVIADAVSGEAFPKTKITRAIDVFSSSDKATDKRNAKALKASLAESDLQTRYWLYFAIFMTQEGNPRQRVMTDNLGKACPETHEFMIQEQARMLAAEQARRAVVIAGMSAAILHLGSAVIGQFKTIKNSRGLMDYDDLIEQAAKLLTRADMAAWVLYKLDTGLDHILLDEAQDTSAEQWQVIEALTEEFMAGQSAREILRTLFVVGDEKQSIFSFQGADPKLFDRMRRLLAARVKGAGQPFNQVPLNISFRSSPDVLAAVDKVFEQETARNGLTVSNEAVVHTAIRQGHAGLVELWPPVRQPKKSEPLPWQTPVDQVTEDHPRCVLAKRIAATIRHWLDTGEQLEARSRAIHAGDILILVRRRSAFVNELIEQLKTRNIPVAGADRMILSEQIAVMDLIALGQFCLLPIDDLICATVLKTPLIGFDDEDLIDLAVGRGKNSLWAVLQQKATENQRYYNVCEDLKALISKSRTLRVFEFFCGVLAAGGGRKKIIARLGAQANDPLNEFLSQILNYERHHTPDLQGFLHWISKNETQLKRDMEHGKDEVRIMTVHGAKGLEAPIVFLPDTCTKPTGRHDPKFLTLEDDPHGALIWVASAAQDTSLSEAARARAREVREQEYRRLLYVAMTRAEDRLYICGYKSYKNLPENCWYDLIERGLEGELNEVRHPVDGEPVWRKQSPHAGAAHHEKPVAQDTLAPLSPEAWATTPAPAEPAPARSLSPSRLEAVQDHTNDPGYMLGPAARSPLTSHQAGEQAHHFTRGILIHRLLQGLPDLPQEKWAAAAKAYLALPGHQLAPDQQEEIWRETHKVLTHQDFSCLFGESSRAEVPITGLVSDRFWNGQPLALSGQIDRLVVTKDTVFVVDFKTNRAAPNSIDEVAPLYLRQMAAYRLALQAIYPAHTIRAVLLWTDGPFMMELPGALLDMQFALARRRAGTLA